MKITRRKRVTSSVDIAMTPLVDLFLNILIFFLVTTSFTADTVFFVDLPEAKASQDLGETKKVSIQLSASGRVAFNNQVIEVSALKVALEQIPSERRNSIPVVLRADQNTSHGTVVKVIDILREVGLQNVGIVTETAKERM